MNKITSVLAFLLAFLLFLQWTFFSIEIGNGYYIVAIVSVGILLLPGRFYHLNYYMVWLIIAIILSIVFNEIPAYFKPFERFLAFLVVVSLVGPLINSSFLQTFRNKLFEIFNVVLLVFILASFISIVLGLPISIGRGGYVGLFKHSMILGPMAALSLLYSLNKAHLANLNIKKVFFWIIFGISFLTCLVAASRAALLGALIGMVFYFYKVNQGKITRFFRVLISVLILIVVSFPLWEPYTESLSKKISYSENQGSVLYTRENKWNERWSEFVSSPYVGIGFASVDPATSRKGYDTETGVVEPGSSWLAVLSMTGILGLLPFLFMNLKYSFFLIKNRINKKRAAYFGSILFYFLVNMVAEGYVFAAGSVLFFYYWLIMGLIQNEVYLVNTLNVRSKIIMRK